MDDAKKRLGEMFRCVLIATGKAMNDRHEPLLSFTDDEGNVVRIETTEERDAVVIDSLQSDMARIVINSLEPHQVVPMLTYMQGYAAMQAYAAKMKGT